MSHIDEHGNFHPDPPNEPSRGVKVTFWVALVVLLAFFAALSWHGY